MGQSKTIHMNGQRRRFRADVRRKEKRGSLAAEGKQT